MTKWKIGFIVEGDVDKAVVGGLAHRLLGEDFQIHPVRLGSTIAVPWAYSTVLALLEEAHCQHVMVVLDADSPRVHEIERRQRQIESMMRQHRLEEDEVTVCLAVPEIEAWLLAAYVDKPEERPDPKQDLLLRLGTRGLRAEHVKRVVEELDIEKARKRAPSFDRFVGALERLAKRLKQAPAA